MSLTPSRSIDATADLLQNPQFCDDARGFLETIAPLRQQAPSLEEWAHRLYELARPFLTRWGVPPPQTGELLDRDPRRRVVEAVCSGRWGIILVFPETTDQEVRQHTKRIRRWIPKQHHDALTAYPVQLAEWLELCGFNRSVIAQAILGRQTGLRRPTKAEAVARTSQDRESQIYKEYRRRGFTGHELERRVHRRLRGSEPRAGAALRMAEARYFERTENLNAALAAPRKAEPLSYALTMLFRALPDLDDRELRRLVVNIGNAFRSKRSVAARVTDDRGDEASYHAAFAAKLSRMWFVVPIFPWTRDPEIKALLKRIRTVVRPRRHNVGRAASRSTLVDPLSEALRMLLRALAIGDDAALRRHATATQAAVRRIPLS